MARSVEAAREKEAVKHADAVLARTQPSTNVLYQSKGFREAPKVFKWWSAPLEKLFQIGTGMPEQIRRGQAAYVARYCAGAALTGIALAVFMRKTDGEDLEEPEKLLKKLAYYGLAEPLFAHVPLAAVSSFLSWTGERFILGGKRPAPQRDFLPVLTAAEVAERALESGKGDRIKRSALEIAGYLFAMPTVQIRRVMKAVENRDPWGAVAGER
jgi:hypothetical protein